MTGAGARIVRWAVVLLAFALTAGGEARAGSPRFCRQLEAALAGAGGTPSAAAAYDRAIAAQSAEVAKVKTRLVAASCGRSFFGGLRCAPLRQSLAEMQRNLSSLSAKRSALDRAPTGAERRRLLASLEAQGCRGTARTAGKTERGGGDDFLLPALDRPRFGTPFCVRTCDGYFFPMTRTTAPVEDQQVCEAACPGTEMEVFFRRGGGDKWRMTSARTGQPYSELSNAFLFRDPAKPQPPGCGCHLRKLFEATAAPAVSGSAPVGASFDGRLWGTPAEPDRAQTNDIRPTLAPAPSADAGQRKVRVVAPAFLPDPEEAIKLPAPAPTAGR